MRPEERLMQWLHVMSVHKANLNFHLKNYDSKDCYKVDERSTKEHYGTLATSDLFMIRDAAQNMFPLLFKPEDNGFELFTKISNQLNKFNHYPASAIWRAELIKKPLSAWFNSEVLEPDFANESIYSLIEKLFSLFDDLKNSALTRLQKEKNLDEEVRQLKIENEKLKREMLAKINELEEQLSAAKQEIQQLQLSKFANSEDNFTVLNTMIQSRMQCASRVKHGIFKGQLPRNLRELDEILVNMKQGTINFALGLVKLHEVAQKMGKNDPITTQIQQCMNKQGASLKI